MAGVQKTSADAVVPWQQLDRGLAARETKPAATTSDVAELRNAIRAIEAKPTVAASEIGELRQQQEKLGKATADLNSRVAALEKSESAQSVADPTDAALLLAMLRIRDAVETARPFTAEYDAVAVLARARPDIAASAAPLAEPA